jgi:hypothetical protein
LLSGHPDDNSVFEGKVATVAGVRVGVTIRSAEGPLRTALADPTTEAARVATATACRLLGVGQCVAPSSRALFLRAASDATPVLATLSGFTVHSFGFPGIHRCVGSGTTSECSDYWGAPDGGAFVMMYAELNVLDCVIHTNVAKRGGAAYMLQSTLSLRNTIVRDNVAQEEGGAIFSQISAVGNPVTLWAYVTGQANSYDVSVRRGLFVGNQAGGQGGALAMRGTKLLVDNAVLTANTAGLAASTTARQNVACCQGLPIGQCECNAGGMLLYGGTHSFTDLLAEENTCTKAAGPARRCQTFCVDTPTFSIVPVGDFACFCPNTCTSARTAESLTAQMSNPALPYSFEVGMRNFFDAPASTPFRFGGANKTWTVTFGRPVHMVRVEFEAFDLTLQEEYLDVFEKGWGEACSCHASCVGGSQSDAIAACRQGCVAAYYPSGRCDTLATGMTGTAGYTVVASQLPTGGSAISLRLRHALGAGASSPAATGSSWFTRGGFKVTLRALNCAAAPTARAGCTEHGVCQDYGYSGSGAATWYHSCVCDAGYVGADCANRPVRVRSALAGSASTHFNLQQAVDGAAEGDTLTILAPAVLSGAGNTGLVLPPRSLHIRGLDPRQTTLQCRYFDPRLNRTVVTRGIVAQHPSSSVHHSRAARSNVTISAMTLRQCDAPPISPGVGGGLDRPASAFSWPYWVQPSLSRSGRGGALYVQTPASVALRDVVIQNCSAEARGGAVHLTGGTASPLLEDVILQDSLIGGGLTLDGVRATLRRVFMSGSARAVNASGPSSPADSDLHCVANSGAAVTYVGSRLAGEPDQFNCHCATDCARPLPTSAALSITSAMLVSNATGGAAAAAGRRRAQTADSGGSVLVVVHGHGLVMGIGSPATVVNMTLTHTSACSSIQPNCSATSSGCTCQFAPVLVGPALVVCQLGSVNTSIIAAVGVTASLLVTRLDGVGISAPLALTSGIDAMIEGAAVTSENGGVAVLALRLRSRPAYPVMIPISAGIAGVDGSTVASPSVDAVWFSATNWHTYQRVTLTGQEDGLVRGAVSYTVRAGPAASADVAYGAPWPGATAVSGADVAALPSTAVATELSLVNYPFACPRDSEVLTPSGMACECAAGFYQRPDGPDGRTLCEQCPPGMHKALQGNGPCTRCPGDIQKASGTQLQLGSVSVAACVCRPGYYARPGTAAATLVCEGCPEGTNCAGWGYTLADVGVQPGFWRAHADSPYVMRCTAAGQCIGAANMSRDEMCRDGTYGHQCYGCLASYGRVGQECKLCPSLSSSWAGFCAWLLPMLTLPLALGLLARPPGIEVQDRTYATYLPVFKVLVSFLQLRLVLNTHYPAWTDLPRTVFAFMGSVSTFSVLEVPSFDCLLQAHPSYPRYAYKLAIAMAMPLATLVPSWLAFAAVSAWRNPFKCVKPHPQAPGLWRWHQVVARLTGWKHTVLLGTLFFGCPAAALAAVSALICDTNEVSGDAYVRADIAIGCGEVGAALKAVAASALVLYGLCFPLLCSWLLWRTRFHRANLRVRQRLVFMLSGYRPEHAHWEVLVLLRNLTVFVLSAVIRRPGIRTATVLLVVQAGLFMHLNRAPYLEDCALASRLETLSLTTTALSLLVALIQSSLDPATPHAAIEAGIVLLNACFALLAAAALGGQVWEETGDKERLPLKVNRPGRLLLKDYWSEQRRSPSVEPLAGGASLRADSRRRGAPPQAEDEEEDPFQKAQLALAMKSRQQAGLGAPSFLSSRQAQRAELELQRREEADAEAEARREREVGGGATSMADEVVYLAKEKELASQLERLQGELKAVQRREKMNKVFGMMARQTGVPRPPTAPTPNLAFMRRGISARGGVQLGEEQGGLGTVPMDRGTQTVDTGGTSRAGGGGGGKMAAAEFEAQVLELEMVLAFEDAGHNKEVLGSGAAVAELSRVFEMEMSAALDVIVRRVHVLHARLAELPPPPEEAIGVHPSEADLRAYEELSQRAAQSLVVRWQLLPSLRDSAPTPATLSARLRRLFDTPGSALYRGAVLRYTDHVHVLGSEASGDLAVGAAAARPPSPLRPVRPEIACARVC